MLTSPKPNTGDRERILFVTGKLAERALRQVVAPLSDRIGFDYDIAVLGISVAALMHTGWVSRKFDPHGKYDRIILPGWCQGDLEPLISQYGMPVQRGPRDLYDLPLHFGQSDRPPPDLSRYDIEIIAEINHAPRMSDAEILAEAERYRRSGADVIDLGCIPGESWSRAGEVTKRLVDNGLRVSIDSFDRSEVESAVAAGAELVLSCNATNREWAAELPAELVAIPDDPRNLDSLDDTINFLQDRGADFRIDPILEPIGFGFAASLARYYEVRRRWPDCEVMMGIGNVTELTEVDTAGVNVLLAALCQELGIRSVLATEVINWARSAVAEFDIARRLVHHSLTHNVLPKHVDSRLVTLRDPRLKPMGADLLHDLAGKLTDPGFRIFAEAGELHVMNRDGYWRGTDPYEVFDRVLAESRSTIDATHAFYLGYEFSKAATALALGKQYTQDQALQWGFLTVPEISAHERRRKSK